MVDSVLLAPRFERLQQRRCIGFRECFHATRLRALLSAPSCLFGFRNLVRLYRYQLAGYAPLVAAALSFISRGAATSDSCSVECDTQPILGLSTLQRSDLDLHRSTE